MKFAFLDPYVKAKYRISKDTAGGYGTANDLGDTLFASLLSRYVKRSVFWPSLHFAQLMQELITAGHTCKYIRISDIDELPDLNSFQAFFICNSIVCFETEMRLMEKLASKTDTPVFICGTVIEHAKREIPNNCYVLSGNYDLIDTKNFSSQSVMNSVFLKKDTTHLIHPEKINHLSVIKWGENGLPLPKNQIISGSRHFIPYIFNRGCPYSCAEYCTYPTSQGKKVISQSIEKVLKDLYEISVCFPRAHIVFRDPVFSINLKKAKELLSAIKAANLNLEYSAELHLKNIDEEFIGLASEANFSALKFGIESAFSHIRDSVKRISVSNDVQFERIDCLRKYNIKSVGMFILAQPSDTYETCEETINYACQLNLDIAQFSVFTPYPGTAFHKLMEPEITAQKFEDYTQFKLNFEHTNLTSVQVRELLGKAYWNFALSKGLRLFDAR